MMIVVYLCLDVIPSIVAGRSLPSIALEGIKGIDFVYHLNTTSQPNITTIVISIPGSTPSTHGKAQP